MSNELKKGRVRESREEKQTPKSTVHRVSSTDPHKHHSSRYSLQHLTSLFTHNILYYNKYSKIYHYLKYKLPKTKSKPIISFTNINLTNSIP